MPNKLQAATDPKQAAETPVASTAATAQQTDVYAIEGADPEVLA